MRPTPGAFAVSSLASQANWRAIGGERGVTPVSGAVTTIWRNGGAFARKYPPPFEYTETGIWSAVWLNSLPGNGFAFAQLPEMHFILRTGIGRAHDNW